MKKTVTLLLSAVVSLSILTSCGAEKPDEFNAAISALDCTANPMYAKITSLSELMETAKPNLIIHGKVTSRADSIIIDHSGEYNTDYLSSSAQPADKQWCAAAFLSTPYTIEVEEILLSEPLSSADSVSTGVIEIDAPYGIIGDYFRRDGLHPILKVGQEYLFFLRTDYMYGDQIYYLAFDPVSALELSADGTFTGEYSEWIDGIFGEYGNSTARLLDDLKQLISNNDYDLSMDSFSSATKKVTK